MEASHHRVIGVFAAQLADMKASRGGKVGVLAKKYANAAHSALTESVDSRRADLAKLFMPVLVLADVFNPAALGWTKAPSTCRACCPCFVWCCNRMPSQEPLFLVQQLAADGRPYGCCHTRRDSRSDPTQDWIAAVRADEEEHPPIKLQHEPDASAEIEQQARL